MDYAQRMNDFAAKCGLPAPETASGAVVIDVNGIAVSFLDHASGGEIILHAAIGEPSPGEEGRAARALLEANAALRERSGAILCQDPETKGFAAIRSIPLRIAEPDVLAETVADLVKTATTWRKRFVGSL